VLKSAYIAHEGNTPPPNNNDAHFNGHFPGQPR